MADDARIGQLLDSLRGSGRGVGELVEAVDLLLQRLRKAEAALAVRRARGSGVAAAVADPERAAALQEILENQGLRLRLLETASAEHADKLAGGWEREQQGAEYVGSLTRRLQTLEIDAPKLKEQVSGLASAEALGQIGRRLTELEGAHRNTGQHLHTLESDVDALAPQAAETRRRVDSVWNLAGTYGARLQSAESTLAETTRLLAEVGSNVESLATNQNRTAELVEGFGQAVERLQALEADSVLHARNFGSVWESLTGLPERVTALDARLTALAEQEAAHASRTADDRLTTRGLADTIAGLGERLEGALGVLGAHQARADGHEQHAERQDARAAALESRVDGLVAAVDAATADAVGARTIALESAAGIGADDPRIRYMRHTGTPHAPDIYLVQGSQFSQDGITKVVRRCRHCDYRETVAVEAR